ncbi:hypothetical protein PHMEG_0007182 [Phytophthora megakarya]|uniref:Uncharacterized protein n=1 Tax=Phytophthora megakarya TaxID=4795 RepID=A0A225WLY3_9STRA|nr:hypothetical protein PHMEG_0007182 [Phytophthora megakarya]
MASPTRKRAKRIVPFLDAHEYLYGVRVVERDPASHEVTSVLCMFCAAFGREDDPCASSRRRARTQKTKYWSGPTFRTDNYKSHLTMQHPVRWREYQDLLQEQKQTYFGAVQALPKSGSAATAQSVQVESESVVDDGQVLTFLLDREVVVVALGNVLFRAEDAVEGDTIAVFESTLDPSDTEDQQRSDGTAEVRVVVRSVRLFHRVVDLLAVGLSFSQIAEICQPLVTPGIRAYAFVTSMARVAIGANLQALSRILQQSWAFSLSLHGVDRRRSGETEPSMFLDVCVRVYCSSSIRMFHVLALPVESGGDPKTVSEILFETLAKFLLSVHKRWSQKVISCSTELIRLDDSSINSVVSAVASSLAQKVEQQALPGFVRISNVQTSLDALVQRFFDAFLLADDAEWHSHLTRLLAYLQRQVNVGNAEELHAASVTSCPCVPGTRWWKLTDVARWFDNARVPIQRLLARRNASVAPPAIWWLELKVILVVGSTALKTRAGLREGYASLFSQQPQRISMLRLALAGDVGVEGPLPGYQRAALRDQSGSGEMIGSNDGMFAVKPHSIVTFVRGTGSWAAELFDNLNVHERQKIIIVVADKILDLVQGLHGLAEDVEERGSSSNTSLSSFPPVLPHQVSLLHPVDFQEIIRMYRPRLAKTFSSDRLALVETQHSELRTAATGEPAVRQLLDTSAENLASSFDQFWEALRPRWNMLVEFCGGLATVFPTASDSISNASTAPLPFTTGSQSKLAGFSLESRLQCQQFAALHALHVDAGW